MSRSRRHILRIGVTGGIGSGKSTACRIFRTHRIPVIEADKVARELTDSNPTIRKKILRVLGAAAYRPDGHLNRPFVASRLFGSRRIQHAINAAVHPPVLREINRRIRLYERAGQRAVVVEAALIFESGADRFLDIIIVMEADKRRSISRIRKRDGLSADAVRRRMASQWSSGEKKRMADILIRNNGTVAELRKKIRFLLEMFRLMPGGRIHA